MTTTTATTRPTSRLARRSPPRHSSTTHSSPSRVPPRSHRPLRLHWLLDLSHGGRQAGSQTEDERGRREEHCRHRSYGGGLAARPTSALGEVKPGGPASPKSSPPPLTTRDGVAHKSARLPRDLSQKCHETAPTPHSRAAAPHGGSLARGGRCLCAGRALPAVAPPSRLPEADSPRGRPSANSVTRSVHEEHVERSLDYRAVRQKLHRLGVLPPRGEAKPSVAVPRITSWRGLLLSMRAASAAMQRRGGSVAAQAVTDGAHSLPSLLPRLPPRGLPVRGIRCRGSSR